MDRSTGFMLEEALERAGMSKRGLSAASGVGYRTVCRIAAGDRMGNLDTWMRFAEVLGCSVSELTGEVDPPHGGGPRDSEKIERVDRWLEDVSGASKRWRSAKAAQQSSERVVAYLKEIRSRVNPVPQDLKERMDEAIAANQANAYKLARSALEQSERTAVFYEVLESVKPSEVAEAWRLRCVEGKTWAQCSMALHYNRQHLERLSKRAKVEVYGLIPGAYRHGR